MQRSLRFRLAEEVFDFGVGLDHGLRALAMPHGVFALVVRHASENIDFKTGEDRRRAAQNARMKRGPKVRRTRYSSFGHGEASSRAIASWRQFRRKWP